VKWQSVWACSKATFNRRKAKASGYQQAWRCISSQAAHSWCQSCIALDWQEAWQTQHVGCLFERTQRSKYCSCGTGKQNSSYGLGINHQRWKLPGMCGNNLIWRETFNRLRGLSKMMATKAQTTFLRTWRGLRPETTQLQTKGRIYACYFPYLHIKLYPCNAGRAIYITVIWGHVNQVRVQNLIIVINMFLSLNRPF